MNNKKVSVIVPTHNRPDKLADTLKLLKRQALDDREYEIVVVDDGSSPAVTLSPGEAGPTCRLVRTEGLERSGARNRGAEVATGELLIFIDDDISVAPDFIAAHLRATAEWRDALIVGAIRLPEAAMKKPFVRFRQALEQQGMPRLRGNTAMRNFCTAANVSIPRELFRTLGGFDSTIASSEDQDLALRHTGRGGQIVFLPEAAAVHRDDALDIRSYCRRAQWGTEQMIPFCQRYPDWPDNIERERVNSPVRFAREPLSVSLRKIVKQILAWKPVVESLFAMSAVLERLAPNGRTLDRVYRLLLGAHIVRGYQRGRKRSANSAQKTAMTPKLAADSYLEVDR